MILRVSLSHREDHVPCCLVTTQTVNLYDHITGMQMSQSDLMTIVEHGAASDADVPSLGRPGFQGDVKACDRAYVVPYSTRP